MGHEIDQTTGSAAMVYNANNGDPWHGLGVAVHGAMTADDVFERCPALDFEVALAPAYADISHFDPSSKSVRIPRWCGVVRKDTNAVLGIVQETFRTLQNREVAAFADGIRDSSDAAYDTAMSLYGGRLVIFQMILGDDIEIAGDKSPWMRRLLVWSGHDGLHALTATRTATRVVCANTWRAATADASGVYKVRHTSGMQTSMDEVRKALDMAIKADDTFYAAMTALAKRKVTLDQVLAFTEDLLPDPVDSPNPVRTREARATIVNLFTDSPTLEGVNKTAYRLLQSVGEYADHYRTYSRKGGTKDEARAESILDGRAQDIKAKALALLTR